MAGGAASRLASRGIWLPHGLEHEVAWRLPQFPSLAVAQRAQQQGWRWAGQHEPVPEEPWRQRAALVAFYGSIGAQRTEGQCAAMLERRGSGGGGGGGGGGGLSTLAFSKLCAKLHAKYGRNPLD